MDALSPNTVVVFFFYFCKNHSACGISLIRTRNISFNSLELLGSTALREKKNQNLRQISLFWTWSVCKDTWLSPTLTRPATSQHQGVLTQTGDFAS